MHRATILLVTALSFAPFVATADVLQDWHVPVIPRATDEAARIAALTAPTTDFSKAETSEDAQAGTTTAPPDTTDTAFSHPSANITPAQELDFTVGNALFRRLWIVAPSPAIEGDGLGPLYNALSCVQCHIKDGRGHPPQGQADTATSFVLRLSVPGASPQTAKIADYLATIPEPTYGAQVQDAAIAGHTAEARLSVAYTEIDIALAGGENARLRVPDYTLSNLGYGPLHPEVMISPRIAPQMIGLGLLEAIPLGAIIGQADPDDIDGDGISGRAQIVWSMAQDRPMLGRFGHKAGQPSLREQTAAAFHSDIGISTTLLREGYGDCTLSQTACRTAPHGNTDRHDGAEISDLGLELVTFYSANLAVPPRRDVDDPQVLHGKRLFYETGCTGCHTPKYMTHRLAGDLAQSDQLIWPYTDMLLHDMGPGLADNRPEARASGREWRTPPLWGIGLTKQVSDHTSFLHDGRARNLLEAVLWHGGEAETQKQKVIDMPPFDRAALLRFLHSL